MANAEVSKKKFNNVMVTLDGEVTTIEHEGTIYVPLMENIGGAQKKEKTEKPVAETQAAPAEKAAAVVDDTKVSKPVSKREAAAAQTSAPKQLKLEDLTAGMKVKVELNSPTLKGKLYGAEVVTQNDGQTLDAAKKWVKFYEDGMVDFLTPEDKVFEFLFEF
jgi:hypothetical protein